LQLCGPRPYIWHRSIDGISPVGQIEAPLLVSLLRHFNFFNFLNEAEAATDFDKIEVGAFLEISASTSAGPLISFRRYYMYTLINVVLKKTKNIFLHQDDHSTLSDDRYALRTQNDSGTTGVLVRGEG